CAAPAGLLGSYRGPPPIAFQRHWPDQSGYLDSSCAEAAVAVANVAAIVSTPIRIRTIMGCSPCARVGNGASWRPTVDAKRYRVEEARRSHPFSRDFPGGAPMLKRVVAIFDATQKSANLLERWPEMAPGHLEGMTAWVIRYRSLRGEN